MLRGVEFAEQIDRGVWPGHIESLEVFGRYPTLSG